MYIHEKGVKQNTDHTHGGDRTNNKTVNEWCKKLKIEQYRRSIELSNRNKEKFDWENEELS